MIKFQCNYFCFSFVFVGSLVIGPPLVLYLFYYINIGLSSEAQLRPLADLTPRRHYVDNTETKYILTWCEAYGSLKYGWEFGEDKFRQVWPGNIQLFPNYFFRTAGCLESRCFLTSDRNYLGSVSEFDAIIFHQRSIQLKDTPAKRRPEQRYVQWMFESPSHSNYDFTPAKKLAGFFNWSMSYRLDSDFPRPYGSFKKVQFNKNLCL